MSKLRETMTMASPSAGPSVATIPSVSAGPSVAPMASPSTSRSARDARFEAFRILAMVLILICHFTAFMPWKLESAQGWEGVLAIVVDKVCGQVGTSIFFFVSGYFLAGKRRVGENIVRIIVQTVIYSWTILVLYLAFGGWLRGAYPELADPFAADKIAKTLVGALLPVMSGRYWFVSAYVGVLLCVPLLNKAVDNDYKMLVRAILLCVTFSVLHDFTLGVRYYSHLLYGITLYLVGVWMRVRGQALEPRVPMRVLVVLSAVSVASVTLFVVAVLQSWPIAVFLGWHNQYLYGLIPAATITVAACVFIAGLRLFRLCPRALSGRCASRVVGGFASATLGVYLIHMNPLVYPALWCEVARATERLGVGQGIAASCLCVLVLYLALSLIAMVFDALVAVPATKGAVWAYRRLVLARER